MSKGEGGEKERERKSTLSHGRRFIIYKNMQGCTLVQQDCCVTREPDVNYAPCHPSRNSVDNDKCVSSIYAPPSSSCRFYAHNGSIISLLLREGSLFKINSWPIEQIAPEYLLRVSSAQNPGGHKSLRFVL